MKRLPKFFAIFFILILTGQGCFGGGGGNATAQKSVELNIWRVFDDDDTFDGIIAAYRASHPNVKINYRELRFNEYEKELVSAFAEDRAPDIFSIHNNKIGEFQSLMLPMPATVTITQQEQRGTVRKEVVVVTTEKKTISQRELKQRFVEQVPKDVIRSYQPNVKIDAEERIFGLPLSVDTLAMFYNKDLLNAAGIATPPTSWTDLQEAVIALTTYDESGEVLQSGAAMGESDNVERSTDILSLLMMQNGTEMTDERGRITFNQIPAVLDDLDIVPGIDATVFYTDFANPTKQVYTWNDSFPSSFEAFANGDTAFFFGYSYHIPLLRTTAPKLNFDIASVPQINGGREVNYANYWVEAVSKDTENPDWAWDFLQFATHEDNVPSYLTEANKPTALRSLISTQLDDEDLAVFAKQTLTAESWYLGIDANAMEEAMRNLIDDILAGPEKLIDPLNNAARKVSQTY